MSRHGSSIRSLSGAFFLTSTLLAAPAQAQTNEERFQDLFVTAGYATAFGAAIGTACLAWTDDPSANLQYVAMGASLGFLGGSIMGSWVIFSPMLGDASEPRRSTLLGGDMPKSGLVVRPVFDQKAHRLVAVEGGMTLFSF